MKCKAVLIVIACVFLMSPVCRADTPPVPQPPSAFLPITTFNFPEVVEGTQVVHDFIVLNKGAGPLTIKKVETS